MIKIYFDGVKVDSDNYISIKDKYKLFESNEGFSLGATPSDSVTIQVPSSLSVPEVVTIKMGESEEESQNDYLYGTYIVDKYEYKDDRILTLHLIDNIIKTEQGYNAHHLFPNEGDTATTKEIFEDICDTFELDYDSSGFTTNDDIEVDYYDNSIHGREYLSYLAEINGGYCVQNEEGEIVLKKFNSTPSQLNTDMCSDFKLGERHKIGKVVYDNGIVRFEKELPSSGGYIPLPEGYTQIEYLQTPDTGACDIHLDDATWAAGSSIEIDFEVTKQNLFTSSSWICGFQSNLYYGVFGSSSYQLRVGVRDATAIIAVATTGKKYHLETNATATNRTYYKVTLDGEEIANTYLAKGAPDSGNYHFRILSRDYTGSGSNYAKGIKLYRFKAYKEYSTKTPTYDLVPCIRTSDNKPGMINLLDNHFFLGTGTGTFITGPVILPPDPGETLYLNPNNVYINNQETVDNIADEILGFEYYNFSTKNCPIDDTVKAGNLLTITDGNNTYNSIIQYDIKYNGAWLGGYSLDLKSKFQDITTVIGESPESKAIKIIINREKNRVDQVIEDVSDNSGQISVITQNQDSLHSSVAGLTQGYTKYIATEDENFQANKEYYEYIDSTQSYSKLIYDSTNQTYTTSSGTVYHVNDSMVSGIYEGVFVKGLDELGQAVVGLEGTFTDIAQNSITTYFSTATFEDTDQTYNQLLEALRGQTDDLGKFKELMTSYITGTTDKTTPVLTHDVKYLINKRYWVVDSQSLIGYRQLIEGTDYNVGDYITGTVYESEHFGDSYLELGAAENQTKIRIYPNEVLFLTNGTKTAYISDNSLYITESTILTKERVGHWMTYEDHDGNLNTKWVE